MVWYFCISTEIHKFSYTFIQFNSYDNLWRCHIYENIFVNFYILVKSAFII